MAVWHRCGIRFIGYGLFFSLLSHDQAVFYCLTVNQGSKSSCNSCGHRKIAILTCICYGKISQACYLTDAISDSRRVRALFRSSRATSQWSPRGSVAKGQCHRFQQQDPHHHTNEQWAPSATAVADARPWFVRIGGWLLARRRCGQETSWNPGSSPELSQDIHRTTWLWVSRYVFFFHKHIGQVSVQNWTNHSFLKHQCAASLIRSLSSLVWVEFELYVDERPFFSFRWRKIMVIGYFKS